MAKQRTKTIQDRLDGDEWRELIRLAASSSGLSSQDVNTNPTLVILLGQFDRVKLVSLFLQQVEQLAADVRDLEREIEKERLFLPNCLGKFLERGLEVVDRFRLLTWDLYRQAPRWERCQELADETKVFVDAFVSKARRLLDYSSLAPEVLDAISQTDGPDPANEQSSNLLDSPDLLDLPAANGPDPPIRNSVMEVLEEAKKLLKVFQSDILVSATNLGTLRADVYKALTETISASRKMLVR